MAADDAAAAVAARRLASRHLAAAPEGRGISVLIHDGDDAVRKAFEREQQVAPRVAPRVAHDNINNKVGLHPT